MSIEHGFVVGVLGFPLKRAECCSCYILIIQQRKIIVKLNVGVVEVLFVCTIAFGVHVFVLNIQIFGTHGEGYTVPAVPTGGQLVGCGAGKPESDGVGVGGDGGGGGVGGGTVFNVLSLVTKKIVTSITI